MDLFEVAVKEACYDAVFVLIDLVSVEARVLLDQVVQVSTETKVGVDGEALRSKSLKVEQVVRNWEFLAQLCHERGTSELTVDLD